MGVISCPLGGVGFHAALSLALGVPERGQWGSPVPSPFVLVGPDKPGHVTTLLMLSHFFLVKAFLHIHLAGAATFFVQSCPAHPILSFKNQTFFCLFWVTQPRKRTKTNYFFLIAAERRGTSGSGVRTMVLWPPARSTLQYGGDMDRWVEENTAGGGNTVIYGGNIVYNLE